MEHDTPTARRAPDERPVVFLTRRLPDAVEDRLRSRYTVIPGDDARPVDDALVAHALESADALLCTVTDPVRAAAITREPRRARIVASFGVGVDHIDLSAARAARVVVTNTPGVLTEDTADLALLLLLMTARRAGAAERELRAGAWKGWRPTHFLGTSVHGRTLGVVCMGRIGLALARRAHAGLGMRVLYHNRRRASQDVERSVNAHWCATLDKLLAESDFVSLHCPATPETRHLINAARLAVMKPGAFLINTGRGELVDERALVQALDAGRLAGAGVDVYENEPTVSAALRERDDVVLLPHIGSATTDTRVAMGMRAADNLDAFFAGREPPDRVV
ncbi:MAG TPA: D-glycerate dehydrogenase [Gemmatimonadaceae bacterium]|nr:D-glycerate dehydrogenase [Gemmatimonadaceae bacterium]